MPMWAICRRSKSAGFTLLEILVVLAIAGLLVGVALPQMSGMAERVRIANQRQGILLAIENLGYRAYASGQSIILQSSLPEKSGNPSPLLPLPFDLPEGWQVNTAKPIIYAINGVCSGGSFELISPDRRMERFQLSAPRCHAQAIAEG